MSIKCFFLEPVSPELVRVWLRRYGSRTPCPNMPGQYGYHDARALLGEAEGNGVKEQENKPDAADARWPAACSCGYQFVDEDERQVFTNRLYRRADTGELTTLGEAPAGAMWYADWLSDHGEYKGPDGRTLIVRCPPDGHDWIVDSRANNCTLPDDKVHKCWVRHGTPPNITVDKNGHTCSAGAGSILTPKWHGFLRNGELVE